MRRQGKNGYTLERILTATAVLGLAVCFIIPRFANADSQPAGETTVTKPAVSVYGSDVQVGSDGTYKVDVSHGAGKSR